MHFDFQCFRQSSRVTAQISYWFHSDLPPFCNLLPLDNKSSKKWHVHRAGDKKSTIHICSGSFSEAITRGRAHVTKTMKKFQPHQTLPHWPHRFWKILWMLRDTKHKGVFVTFSLSRFVFSAFQVFSTAQARPISCIVVLSAVWKHGMANGDNGNCSVGIQSLIVKLCNSGMTIPMSVKKWLLTIASVLTGLCFVLQNDWWCDRHQSPRLTSTRIRW